MTPQQNLPGPRPTTLQKIGGAIVAVGVAAFLIFVVLPIVGAVIVALLAVGLVFALILGVFGWWHLRKFRKRFEQARREGIEDGQPSPSSGRKKINVKVRPDKPAEESDRP